MELAHLHCVQLRFFILQQIIIVRGLLDYYLWKNYGISTFTLSSIKVFHFAANYYSTGSPGLLPLEKLWN